MKKSLIIKEKANAKINLFLDVKSVRADGFHDLDTVMHSLTLCDIVTVSVDPSEKTNIELKTDFDLPTDSRNLAYLAAEKYLTKAGVSASLKIELQKNIPVGAGLGGGSSDAAAVIRALNKIYGVLSQTELLELALSIGSDVPFCVLGGTYICAGRGMPVRQLAIEDQLYFVVAKGEGSVSTKDAYLALDEMYHNTDGGFGFSRDFSGCSKVVARSNGEMVEIPIYNIFEPLISSSFDGISFIKSVFEKHGAKASVMSGSGPSVIAIFDTMKNADDAAKELEIAKFFAITALSAPYNII